MCQKRQSGASLPEVITVMGIAIVLAAVTLPYMAAAMANLKARSAGDELAGLFQQARMTAVRDNKYYTVLMNMTALGGGRGLGAQVQGSCVDSNWSGDCDAGEPSIQFNGEVQVVSAGAPDTTVITCGSSTTACPAGYTGLNFTPQSLGAKPTFNARGLPCVGNPANQEPRWPNSACYTIDPTGGAAGGKSVGFLFVIRYNGALGASYSAVAVTPAGRVTVWTYSGNVGGVDKWVR